MQGVQIDAASQGDGIDVLWGAKAIGRQIGRTGRQVNHMFWTGQLPVKKIGGRLCAKKSDLSAFFGMSQK